MKRVWLLSCVLLLLCSCCKTQRGQGSLRPEWSARIPTYESQEIFCDGLINLPKSGDIMVVPTTIHDGGFMWEDNRLCGMDLKTGEVKWYFPSDLDNRRYCRFDAKGYEYHGKLVFQYETNHNENISLRSTVCIDAKTGSILWERECKAYYNNKPAIGFGKDCYFVQDTCRICSVDMSNDCISEIYYTGDNLLQISDFQLYDDYLVLSCRSDSVIEKYQVDTYVIIIDRTTGSEVFKKYLGQSSVAARNYLDNDTLFANLDRTIMAIDLKTGEKIWERYDMCAYSCQDVLFYNDILMKCAINATIGYDRKTGEVKYLFDNYGSYFVTQAGKYAYFINRKNKIDILDIETGERLDYIECPEKGWSNFWGPYPTIYDDKLYIIGNNTLYRYPTYPW